MPASPEMCALFDCEPGAPDDEVAREIVERGGGDRWAISEFAPGAVEFLMHLGRDVAAVLRSPEAERHIDVPKRIESIVRFASLNYLPRWTSPAILLALNPKARIPGYEAATILHLHQLARMQAIEELVPFVTTMFQYMVDYHDVVDTTRTFFVSYA